MPKRAFLIDVENTPLGAAVTLIQDRAQDEPVLAVGNFSHEGVLKTWSGPEAHGFRLVHQDRPITGKSGACDVRLAAEAMILAAQNPGIEIVVVSNDRDFLALSVPTQVLGATLRTRRWESNARKPITLDDKYRQAVLESLSAAGPQGKALGTLGHDLRKKGIATTPDGFRRMMDAVSLIDGVELFDTNRRVRLNEVATKTFFENHPDPLPTVSSDTQTREHARRLQRIREIIVEMGGSSRIDLVAQKASAEGISPYTLGSAKWKTALENQGYIVDGHFVSLSPAMRSN